MLKLAARVRLRRQLMKREWRALDLKTMKSENRMSAFRRTAFFLRNRSERPLSAHQV
ncbi:hypothetical protein [Marimonas lutisalis]|uniref:hypothetical protein n=1 Tax=Marimonas lutisalis TaxID=2545756 RepID=UPI00137607A8|nr:hypothetical protein [Marimonas lutisalis]